MFHFVGNGMLNFALVFFYGGYMFLSIINTKNYGEKSPVK